jgi:hypothetical protein
MKLGASVAASTPVYLIVSKLAEFFANAKQIIFSGSRI